MNRFKDLAMIIAAVGFVLSTLVHVQALFGVEPPFGQLTWILHAGIFLVFVPAVVETRAFKIPANEFWQVALRGCPKWMRLLLQALFLYALANFAIFLYLGWESPTQQNDASVLEWRGFSGHWMVFYYFSFSLLYSARSLRATPRREDEAIVPR